MSTWQPWVNQSRHHAYCCFMTTRKKNRLPCSCWHHQSPFYPLHYENGDWSVCGPKRNHCQLVSVHASWIPMYDWWIHSFHSKAWNLSLTNLCDVSSISEFLVACIYSIRAFAKDWCGTMDMSQSLHFWMWPAWLKPKHLSITCWFPPQILVHIVLRDCHHGHFLPWEQHGSLWSYYLSLTLWNQTVIFHNTSFHQSKTWFLTPYHPNTTNFYLTSLFLQQVFLFFTLLFFTAQHSTETNLHPAMWALAPKARGASCTNSSYKWNVQLKGAHWEWVPGWPQTKNGTSPLCYLFILLGMKHFTLQIRWYSAVTLYTHVQQ
jgi:hypothetical protein